MRGSALIPKPTLQKLENGAKKTRKHRKPSNDGIEKSTAKNSGNAIKSGAKKTLATFFKKAVSIMLRIAILQTQYEKLAAMRTWKSSEPDKEFQTTKHERCLRGQNF